MADNFSPDDIEMALALSKSEAEKQGLLRLNDEDDAVIDLMDDEGASTEKIRLKLKKYGFRTAAKEDYKSLAVLPVVAGKGGRRGKWANKFTALTLRNPEVQQKKLEEKVSALLAQQVRTKEPKGENSVMPVYKLISSNLQKLRVKSGSQIIREPNEGAIEDLSLYYVTDLIEVSQAPADHLLKNWGAIQGRDLSPERETSKTRQLREQLELVYEELEKHFGDQQQLDQQVNEELDELEKLVAEHMIEDDSKVGANLETETSSASSSPSKEPPDKRPKMTKDQKENIQPAASLASLSIPTQKPRCTSPDLFADSDDEPVMATTSISNEPTDVKDFSLKVYKNLSTSERSSPVKEVEMISSNEEPTQISTYEVYSSSSDEVKTVSNATQEKIFFKDFTTLSESEILQQLYNNGIKPLKRKQAVKILEFIYNQTHPIMQTAAAQDLPPRTEPMARSKSTPVVMEKPRSQLVKSTSEVSLTPTEPRKNFKFKDAWGEDLLRFSQSLPPSLCDDFEIFVTQTNISKKTPQPLVPLHIAWHNLLCANPQLHESVLMYEPIDLQEVVVVRKGMVAQTAQTGSVAQHDNDYAHDEQGHGGHGGIKEV
ncbi:hypothetical protein M5D96_005855 [Drosophila gunungcola]|uniref:Structure-specific endonuclease subunit SLX4 n=1 Tax=Drosophila gunungcola TaxID=103775 RepID=A0A9P9YR12_9MUSC|nr:hypothetical protein M5D96_005855 [Drosophila gunungcola]